MADTGKKNKSARLKRTKNTQEEAREREVLECIENHRNTRVLQDAYSISAMLQRYA